jgi:hypothetical protein
VTNGPCAPVEELGRVAGLPLEHPERRHLETCTRCQALLAMLRSFEAPAGLPEGADFAATDPRLRATIEELVREGREQPETPPRRDERVPLSAGRRGWRWTDLAGPRLAWAFAALIVAGGAGVTLWRVYAPPEAMRASPSQPWSGAPFASASARPVEGGVELRWDAVPGATGYRVVFFDPTLRELARLEPTSATTARLRADSLPAGLVRGVVVGWQVEALAGNDPLARTSTRALRVP